jgi:peptidoglycan/xylan/chitin deacetylase (PgdA/CDA1 family)
MLDTCRSQLLGLYYLATLPHRKRAAMERALLQTVPVMVLFYHRVADTRPNSWTISWPHFRAQMEWISQRFDLITLDQMQHRIEAEVNDQPAVCITFDDGYADNCDQAIPWLLDQNIPFTYFVATDHIMRGTPFSHDVAAGHPLAPNSIDQLREMSRAGVEIGAHTRTHADLGTLDSTTELQREIVGSRDDLEAALQRPIRYFAFPYGLPENMSRDAFQIAYKAGFRGVCSAYGGYNQPAGDPFHIHRIHGDPQWSRLRNWLTVDPRKLSAPDPFDPGDYRRAES